MRRILIVKLSSIGDCLHASPVAQVLRETFPAAYIAWAVDDVCAPAVEGNPYLDAVHVWRKGEGWRGLLRLGRALRVERFDVALDLQGLLKSALVGWSSGAPQRVGPQEAREGARLFYNHVAPRRPDVPHVVERYLLRAAEVGARWERVPPMLIPCGPADGAQMEERLTAYGVREGERLVALHPTTSREIKQWMPERFAQLADGLRAQAGVRIVLTGGRSEQPQVQQVLSAMKTAADAVDLTGQTTLRELAALYRRCALFVGGDTGPLHLAAAAGAPVLALYGPTDPRKTGPYGELHRVLFKQWHCSPCRYSICPIGKACLQAISVEEVLAVACQMLVR